MAPDSTSSREFIIIKCIETTSIDPTTTNEKGMINYFLS